MRQICEAGKLSSAHLLFMDDADRQAAADEGWMLRQTVQFHWLNRQPEGYADFGELRDERIKADTAIENLAGRVDEAWLDADLVWWSGAAKAEMRRPKGPLMVHFFNHQTHHRGQVHGALTACGVDPGDTDLFLVVPPEA